MLFSSPQYIFVFLPLAALVYFLLNRYRLAAAGETWLVLVSLFFYAYWNPVYLLLILGSILVNYAVGTALHRSKSAAHAHKKHARPSRRAILAAGVGFNLALLGYFKYADFFIANTNSLLGTQWPLLHLVLPLAISFFTFQQIAYLVDCHQRDTQEYDFLKYCLFVLFFPQLIAGPIVHHQEMMPQFARARNKLPNWRNITAGGIIFGVGLFKKLVIADQFAVWADLGFANPQALSFLDAWATSLSYTFQLYYDFSGYSDMAIGAALIFNIHLPINFNSPYKATSVQDFWRRWHITLSRWLRDYVYIPLGGNRKGPARTYLNLLLTFVLGGFWHGAGWTFLLWGLLHGLALALHRVWQGLGLRLWRWLAWLVTFLFINLTWVFFRADSLETALLILRRMADVRQFWFSQRFLDQLAALHLNLPEWLPSVGATPLISEWVLAWALLNLWFVAHARNSMHLMEDLLHRPGALSWPRRVGYAGLAAAGLVTLFAGSSQVFLYYNF